MTFRVARHTADLELLSIFYTRVLNLKILGEFKSHMVMMVFLLVKKRWIGI